MRIFEKIVGVYRYGGCLYILYLYEWVRGAAQKERVQRVTKIYRVKARTARCRQMRFKLCACQRIFI